MLSPDALRELVDNPNVQRRISPETQLLIKGARGPVIEVGGTTADLIAPHILPANPITIDLVQWPGKKVDLIADGKNLPFPENSIGLILADHINTADLYDPLNSTFIHKDKVASNIVKREQQIKQESQRDYGRFAANPQDEIRYNLRIRFMREMNRVVQPDGLIAFGAISDQDIQVAELMGWDCIDIFGQRQIADRQTYDVLFRATKKQL